MGPVPQNCRIGRHFCRCGSAGMRRCEPGRPRDRQLVRPVTRCVRPVGVELWGRSSDSSNSAVFPCPRPRDPSPCPPTHRALHRLTPTPLEDIGAPLEPCVHGPLRAWKESGGQPRPETSFQRRRLWAALRVGTGRLVGSGLDRVRERAAGVEIHLDLFF